MENPVGRLNFRNYTTQTVSYLYYNRDYGKNCSSHFQPFWCSIAKPTRGVGDGQGHPRPATWHIVGFLGCDGNRFRRGCDLDFLPRIAEALKLDPKVVTKVYLSERHPKLYHALFAEPIKDWQFDVPGVVVEDIHWRLDQLPRRQRSIIEALIYLLYDLSLAPQTEGDRDGAPLAPSP